MQLKSLSLTIDVILILFYFSNFPIGFKKIFFKVLYNADFRGIDPTAAVKINDSEIKKN